ncbi:unnamed protein product, partial [Heterotrigona itama]
RVPSRLQSEDAYLPWSVDRKDSTKNLPTPGKGRSIKMNSRKQQYKEKKRKRGEERERREQKTRERRGQKRKRSQGVELGPPSVR